MAQSCDRTTDQLTDRPYYSVCNNRLHLHSSEMRPDNELMLYWRMVLTGHTISVKFIMSICISLRTFWMPLVYWSSNQFQTFLAGASSLPNWMPHVFSALMELLTSYCNNPTNAFFVELCKSVLYITEWVHLRNRDLRSFEIRFGIRFVVMIRFEIFELSAPSIVLCKETIGGG